jgi:hypothetical protein
VTVQEREKQMAGGSEGRRGRRTGVLVALVGLVATSGCAYTASAQQPNQVAQTTTTAGAGQESLFAAPLPRMIPGGATTPDTEGENVVPAFCKPVSAGLSRNGSGFLLVVRMAAPIPALNAPPPLPYGVILSMIEFDVGIFAPNVNPELGGGYKYVRQYQTPDRPALEIIPLGAGKTDTAASVNVAVREQEIRIQLPDAGQDTGRVNQWGASVTCLLRHPVDGFYFPFTRFPAGKFERAPL